MNSAFESFTTNTCYEILKKTIDASNCKVRSYEFYAMDEKLGFLGDHCFLEIHYHDDDDREKNVRFFAKAMCSEKSQRIFATETGAFHKECSMFQTLVPKFLKNDIHIIEDCIPTCYSVSDMNYLIFEDLKSQGYRTVNQRKCMPLECVKMCLEALAKFHCVPLIFEEKMKRKFGEAYVLSEMFPKLFKETFYSDVEISVNLLEATKKGVHTQIDLFEDGANLDVDLFKRLACKIFDQFRETVKPSNLFRNTICHGDLWAFNIMFRFEDDRPVHCKIIDFQSYRYGPPAQDFLGFIYLSTDRKFRKKYMGEMTNLYYQKMDEVLRQYNFNIEEILRYEEFLESCDYYKVFSIAQTINHFQLVMSPPEMAKKLFEVPGTLQKLLFEDKSPLVTELSGRDELYRKKMFESITDLKDVLIEKGLLDVY